MEIYQTDNHYIILDGEYSLWCSRRHGSLEPRTGNDLCSAWNPVCIGLVYGVIGKIKIHPESDWKLLLISKQTCVGQISGNNDVYQINRVVVLSLSDAEPVDLDLDLCKKHHFGIKRTERITQNNDGQGKSLQKTLNTLKSAAENIKPRKREVKDKEKFEKKILEELIKMYNETNSFYYCKSHDLTNTIQRQYQDTYDKTLPPWQRCDQRFFWNLYMMEELTEMKTELGDHWILPVMQGCIDIHRCCLEFNETSLDLSPIIPAQQTLKTKDPISYNFILISRRSRHRAGTRSKRRGLDETGACSNYVETEQIIEFSHHRVSFVQVRGSIPVFWSQTGVKYRPPPKLDKGAEETFEAFKKHVDEQLYLYKNIAAVNLTELTGKEKAIGDAYLDNVLRYNSQDVTFVTFDFHEYCRGMKFENVSILTAGVKDIIKHMRYCWVDRKGKICDQRGVFRINCVDCLDRTNVVQTAIARIVMETQCRKLGLLAPDENLPENCRKVFQQVWANTGDAISRQYAGTAALKGDFTRTGERKISGMMKDGVNSANRYYLRFKDTYRQAAIDLTHGQPVPEEILTGKLKEPEEDVRELMEKEENMKMLIEDSKKMLIVEPEECLGGWSLINADTMVRSMIFHLVNTERSISHSWKYYVRCSLDEISADLTLKHTNILYIGPRVTTELIFDNIIYGDPDRQEMDIILLLSQRAVYVAWYDDVEEQIFQYQRIFLEDIEKLEIGSEPSFFKSKTVVMRLYYRHYAEEGFFHTFKMPNTRLFNNLVIAIKTPEEAKEQLTVISEAFIAAQNIMSIQLNVEEKQKLEKKKTNQHPEVVDIRQQQQENLLAKIKLPRDISSNDISSQSSSCRTSPMLGRKLQPSSQQGSHETLDNLPADSQYGGKKSRTLSPAGMKSWLPNMPKLNKANITNIGGNFDLPVPKLNLSSLNLVSKMKMGRAGAGRLLSKVPGTSIFSSNKDKGETQPTNQIDVGTESVDGPVKPKMKLSRIRKYSQDDSSVDEPVEITPTILEREVLLGSCGILATNTKQILESPQCSIEEPDGYSDDELSTQVFDEVPASSEDGIEIVFNIDDLAAKQYDKPDKVKADPSKGEKDSGSIIGTNQNEATGFKCFCTIKGDCPHKNGPESNEDIWVKRQSSEKTRGKISKPSGLDLGQRRVLENSEADQILEKYNQSKKNLTQSSAINSQTEVVAATSENPVTMTIENYSADSPKSILEFDMEINSHLKQQLPNLLQSSKMPRKTQRVYENLKCHIEQQLGDKTCLSTIILI